MKIPDGWFQRLFDLGQRGKASIDALSTQLMFAEARIDVAGEAEGPKLVKAEMVKAFDTYATELTGLVRELTAENEKEKRAKAVAELAAVILSNTLLREMDREAVIKAVTVARMLIEEAAAAPSNVPPAVPS